MNFPQLFDFIKSLDAKYLKQVNEKILKCTLYQPGTCAVHETTHGLILGFLGTQDDTKIQVTIGDSQHSDTVNADQFVYAFEGNIIQYCGQFMPAKITCDKPVYTVYLQIRERSKAMYLMRNTIAYKVKHGYMVYKDGFTDRDFQVPKGAIVFPFLGP